MKLDIKNGQVFNMLTVIEELPTLRLPSGQTNRYFKCICECGKETNVRLVHLSRGRIKSCGCLQGEWHDPKYDGLYSTWKGMKSRCNSNMPNTFRVYKGKGITVCDNWKERFSVFLEWSLENGWEHGLEIDRKDSSKGYYPENCRFLNQLQQANNINTNIIVTYNGVQNSLGWLLDEINRHSDLSTIRTRIKRGWSAQRAIDTPIRQGNYVRGKRQ